MTYRDDHYLILILGRFYYVLLKCAFYVGVTILELESCKVVHFFLTHPLGGQISLLINPAPTPMDLLSLDLICFSNFNDYKNKHLEI